MAGSTLRFVVADAALSFVVTAIVLQRFVRRRRSAMSLVVALAVIAWAATQTRSLISRTSDRMLPIHFKRTSRPVQYARAFRFVFASRFVLAVLELRTHRTNQTTSRDEVYLCVLG